MTQEPFSTIYAGYPKKLQLTVLTAVLVTAAAAAWAQPVTPAQVTQAIDDAMASAKATGVPVGIVTTSSPEFPLLLVSTNWDGALPMLQPEPAATMAVDANATPVAPDSVGMLSITGGTAVCGLRFVGEYVYIYGTGWVMPTNAWIVHNSQSTQFNWTDGVDMQYGDTISAQWDEHICGTGSSVEIGYFTIWRESPPPRTTAGTVKSACYLPIYCDYGTWRPSPNCTYPANPTVSTYTSSSWFGSNHCGTPD